MVTKKNMLSYAKSNGNEKQHALLRQVKYSSNTKLFVLSANCNVSPTVTKQASRVCPPNYFFSNGIQISAGFAGLFGFDRKSVRIPLEKR